MVLGQAGCAAAAARRGAFTGPPLGWLGELLVHTRSSCHTARRGAEL